MTGQGQCGVEVVGVDGELSSQIAEIVQRALVGLGASGPAAGVAVCIDDTTSGGIPWYGFKQDDSQKMLILYCALADFCEPKPLTSTLSLAPHIWEQPLTSPDSPDPGEDRFSPAIAARFLHHHLVFGGDLLNGALDVRVLPARLQEAFQSAWAVTVDGRLAQWALPGYPLFQRRGLFSQLFAGAGILMPDHWQIFQSLWEGGLRTQEAVLGAVRKLPLLAG